MSIYIYKNNEQMGPFEEAKVLEMLGNGQLSPGDTAIRQGGTEWQKLSDIFPNTINKAAADVATSMPVAKKSRKGLLMGCGGFLLLGILISGILGFIGYRNMFPADSTENLPEKVNDFKLDNRYPPKGNIWGTESTFIGLYSNASKTETVLYMMTVYSDETTAEDALRTDLYKSCKSGETPLYFSFNKGGSEVSQGATCAVPLYVQHDNKLVALGGSGASVDTFIEFAENLPFNVGTKMEKKANK